MTSWSERGRLVATETGDQALTAMVATWMRQRAGAPDPHAEIRGVVMLLLGIGGGSIVFSMAALLALAVFVWRMKDPRLALRLHPSSSCPMNSNSCSAGLKMHHGGSTILT